MDKVTEGKWEVDDDNLPEIQIVTFTDRMIDPICEWVRSKEDALLITEAVNQVFEIAEKYDAEPLRVAGKLSEVVDLLYCLNKDEYFNTTNPASHNLVKYILSAIKDGE